MLVKTRRALRDGLKKHVTDNNITVYRGRKDKVTFNNISFNTVNMIIKNPEYKVHNNTVIKLLEFLELPYDIEFFNQNDIVKLYEQEKEKEA